MIFKSVLKYKIFEWCLDALVDKLLTNFIKIPNNIINHDGTIDAHNLQEGMYLSEIRFTGDAIVHQTSWRWLNCKIKSINRYSEYGGDDGSGDNGGSYLAVTWSYTTCLENGNIVDDGYLSLPKQQRWRFTNTNTNTEIGTYNYGSYFKFFL